MQVSQANTNVSTKPIAWLLRPIFYRQKEGELATPSVIRKRYSEKERSAFQRLNYLSLGGIATTIIGIVVGAVGFFKENSLAKLLGGVLSFLGIESFITGYFGGIDLSNAKNKDTPKPDVVSEQTDIEKFFEELKAKPPDATEELVKKYNPIENEIIKRGIRILLDPREHDEKLKKKVEACLSTIGKNKKDIKELVPYLKSNSASLRIWAINEAGNRPQKRQNINKILLESLVDRNPNICCFSAIALAKRKDPDGLQNVVSCIKENRANVYTLLKAINQFSHHLQKLSTVDAINLLEETGFDNPSDSLHHKLRNELKKLNKTLIAKLEKEYLIDLQNMKTEELNEKYKDSDYLAIYSLIKVSSKLSDTEHLDKARQCLANISDKKTIEPLIRCLQNFVTPYMDSQVTFVSEQLINIQDEDVFPALIALLNNDDIHTQWEAINALGEKKNKIAALPLMNKFNLLQAKFDKMDDDEKDLEVVTLSLIALALGKIFADTKDEAITKKIVSLLTVKDLSAKFFVLRSLGFIGGEKAFKALQESLRTLLPEEDPDQDLRKQLLISSAHIKDPIKYPSLNSLDYEGIPTPLMLFGTQWDFINKLYSITSFDVATVEKLLGEMDLSCVPGIMEITYRADGTNHSKLAGELLSRFSEKSEHTVTKLKKYLTASDESICIWAAGSLGKKHDAKANKILFDHIQTKPSPHVSTACAVALGKNLDLITSEEQETINLIYECLREYLKSDSLPLFLKKEAEEVVSKVSTRVVLTKTVERKQQAENEELIASLEKNDFNLSAFLESYKGKEYEIKGQLKEIARDTLLNTSPQETLCRIRAIQCLGKIGVEVTKTILEQISKGDQNSKVKDAASTAYRAIQKRLSKNTVESQKTKFLSELSKIAKVGQVTTDRERMVMLQGFNNNDFKSPLRSILAEILFSTSDNFDYLVNSERVSSIAFDRLQEEAVYLLGKLGDAESKEILKKYKEAKPHDHLASLISIILHEPDSTSTKSSDKPKDPQALKEAEAKKDLINEGQKAKLEEIIRGIIEQYHKIKKGLDEKRKKESSGYIFSRALNQFAKSKNTSEAKILSEAGSIPKHDIFSLAAERLGIQFYF